MRDYIDKGEKFMKLKKEFLLREIAGENILVPMGNTMLSFNGLVTLNELGAFIWSKIEEAKDENDLLKFVLEEYEVKEERAKADINEFLGKLRTAEIL